MCVTSIMATRLNYKRLSRAMDERSRRSWAATEARAIGWVECRNKPGAQPRRQGRPVRNQAHSEKTIVVGDSMSVIWRCEVPFFVEPYRGSEAFEARNGPLVLQVTTWTQARSR